MKIRKTNNFDDVQTTEHLSPNTCVAQKTLISAPINIGQSVTFCSSNNFLEQGAARACDRHDLIGKKIETHMRYLQNAQVLVRNGIGFRNFHVAEIEASLICAAQNRVPDTFFVLSMIFDCLPEKYWQAR